MRRQVTAYDDLPDSIKLLVSRGEYRWTPDKDRLIDDLLTPDLEDDFDDMEVEM